MANVHPIRATEPTTSWLRAQSTAPAIGVDRPNRRINGYVMAQEGPFKTEGRGEFDIDALRTIVRLTNAEPRGLKSRLGHPTLSDDGIGTFLGRAKGAWLDGDRVRADLHLDPSSTDTPNGNIGDYVLNLAESDPAAFSSSLVLNADEEWRIDKKGRPLQDENGRDLPPLWRPTRLHASDVVDTGDAVDDFLSLSPNGTFDDGVRAGVRMLDNAFPKQDRLTIERRVTDWLRRYLNYRFGEVDPDMDLTNRQKAGKLLERMMARTGRS